MVKRLNEHNPLAVRWFRPLTEDDFKNYQYRKPAKCRVKFLVTQLLDKGFRFTCKSKRCADYEYCRFGCYGDARNDD